MRQKTFHIFREIFRTFFSRPTTIQMIDTDEERTFYENYRGKLSCHDDLCVGCGACVRICPVDALDLKRNENNGQKGFELYHDASQCAYCGLCEDTCSFNAINFQNQFVQPVKTKKDSITLLAKGINYRVEKPSSQQVSPENNGQ